MWRVRENVRVFALGRSMCPFCKNTLSWWENIPLVSWVVLRAHCRSCKKRIHISYFLIELFTGALFVFAAQNFLSHDSFSEWELFRDLCFITFLIIIFVYDLRFKEVLLSVIFAGIFIGFGINTFALNYPIQPMLIGLVAAVAFFYFQYAVSNGKWIGGGDVYIGAMMGVWLGWPTVIVALFLAYVLGAIVSVFLLFFANVTRKTPVPFGVFLSTGTFIALYWGDEIINWYLNII
jgi:prepilin signal peptidase PulO-like enzyme (type II secretory pathway)